MAIYPQRDGQAEYHPVKWLKTILYPHAGSIL